jgi:hypothetical protein
MASEDASILDLDQNVVACHFFFAELVGKSISMNAHQSCTGVVVGFNQLLTAVHWHWLALGYDPRPPWQRGPPRPDANVFDQGGTPT